MMKTNFVILFFCLFSLSACIAYAGNNNITASYPAQSGSYNKVVLQNLTTLPACTSSNAGMLFLYTDASGNQSLEMCTNDGTNVAVPYPETCFNRFCTWQDNTQNPTLPNGVTGYQYCPGLSTGCPPGYSWAATVNIPIQDIVTTYTVAGAPNVYYHMESTVCCSNNSTVNPSYNVGT